MVSRDAILLRPLLVLLVLLVPLILLVLLFLLTVRANPTEGLGETFSYSSIPWSVSSREMARSTASGSLSVDALDLLL